MSKPLEKYERECIHREVVAWKECPECREYMVREGLKDEISQATSQERKRIEGIIEGMEDNYRDDTNDYHKPGHGELSEEAVVYNRAVEDILSDLKTKINE